MWYGSEVSRQGSVRPFRSYHPSSLRRKDRRAGAAGTTGRWRRPALRILAAMKIYTRTGDQGQTGLYGGTRVSKSDPRVAAYGDVDELNACLGMVRSQGELAEDIVVLLEQLQQDLFAIGARLANPADKPTRRSTMADGRSTKTTVDHEAVARLEAAIDRLEAELPPLRRFILPGGSRAGALLHFSRTVCRRAERAIVSLGAEHVDQHLLIYVNRLSDLLFVMARAVNHRAGQPETEW
jgi:cob(I)alamin adenosyltransferase